jgi:uncharacterized damage-inducible protein DinB
MRALVEVIAAEFRNVKKLADGALAQVDDAGFFAQPAAVTNSIAIIVKHMAGNLRSRWTDFLTTDGEKPDRNRDMEFVLEPADTREGLLAAWEKGWGIAFDTLAGLSDANLDDTVQVRWEGMTVLQAMQRQLTHAAYHAGQIVLLARRVKGEEWQTLSIRPGESEQYNERMREKAGAAATAPQD